MYPTDKYKKLYDEFKDNESVKGSLSQYLHIAQVMNIEEKNYKKHRKEMNDWLNNIERFIRDHAKDGQQ